MDTIEAHGSSNLGSKLIVVVKQAIEMLVVHDIHKI